MAGGGIDAERRARESQLMTTQIPSSKSLIDLENQYGAHNYHPLDVVLVPGRKLPVA